MISVAFPAAAETYHCAARLVLGFDGVAIDDWRDGSDTQGRTEFSFDSVTGDYLERTAGGAAAIADSVRLEIMRDKDSDWGTILAASGSRSLVLKLDDSAHGVNYVRLDENGLAEIGKCEKAG